MVFLWFSYDCLSKTSTFAMFDDTIAVTLAQCAEDLEPQ